MREREINHKKRKDFPSLSSMGNPYRHFHKMNIENVDYSGVKFPRIPFDVSEKEIDNTLYNKERLKKIRRTVIKGVGGVLITGGIASALAYAVYRGKSY